MKNYKTDDEYVVDISIITDRKSETAEEIRTIIRSVFTKAKNAYGENSAQARWFFVKDLSQLNFDNLFRKAKRVLNKCIEKQSELESFGITNAFITDFSDKVNSLDVDINAKETVENDRDYATNTRNEIANDAYKIIKKIYASGKDYWSSRNEAKYNDYLIYDRAHGTPAEKTKIASQERLVVIDEHILADAEISIVNAGIAELTFWVSERVDSEIPHNALKLPPEEKTKVNANLISDGAYGMLLAFNNSSDEGEFFAEKL